MQQALVLSNKILTEEDISDVLEFHLNGKKNEYLLQYRGHKYCGSL